MSELPPKSGSTKAAIISFFTALILLMISYYTTSVLNIHLQNFAKLEESFRQLRMQDSYISDICMGVSASDPDDEISMHRILYHLQQKEVMQVDLLGNIWGISYLFSDEKKLIADYVNWSVGLYNYIYKHNKCPVSLCSEKELQKYETSISDKFPIDSISLIKRVIKGYFDSKEIKLKHACINQEIK